MAFKDDLNKALEKAVGYFNDGDDVNTAVVKSARDMNFNPDQADRLVERFNTAKTINFFERHPDDRTGSFSVASKEKVAAALFDDDKQEKTASVAPYERGLADYSEYMRDEIDYTNPELFQGEEKTASDGYENCLGALYNDMSDCSAETVGREIGMRARRHYALAKEAEDLAGEISARVSNDFRRIADSVCSGYSPEERFALFKAACGDSPVFAGVEGLVPSWIVESAKQAASKFSRLNVIDLGDMDKEAQDLRAIEKADEEVGELKKLAEKHRELGHQIDTAFRKVAAAMSPSSVSKALSGKGKSSDKDDDDQLKSITDFLQLGSNKVNEGTNDIRKSTSSAMGINVDSVANAFKPKHKSLRDYINNLRRSAIISDLYANDPVLSEADPNQLSAAYKTIVESAPEVSMNKEVVRAILRQSVNSVAVSPFDVKQWSDLENVLGKNRKLVREELDARRTV